MIGIFWMSLVAAPIFARMVECACLNLRLKQPHASVNPVSLALIVPQTCLHVRKNRASTVLSALRIDPVERPTIATVEEQVIRVAIVKWYVILH